MSLRSISTTFGMDNITKIRACLKYVPEFASFEESDFVVKPLTGGLTNLLWTVGLDETKFNNNNSNKKSKSITHTIALIREYGRGTETFMNRPQEEKVVQVLSEQGLCPTVYGVLPWGRVEAFLQGSRTLTTMEFSSKEFIQEVAELLGKFHSQSPTLIELSTTPGKESTLKTRLLSWLTLASIVQFPEEDDGESCRKQRKLNSLQVDSLRAEINWLLEEIESVNSPVVFCHCDYQENNLLIYKKLLHTIDFEYSDRMERGFDIGNSFCEMSMTYHVRSYPGFVINPDDYPSEEKQIEFLRSYAQGAGIEFNDETKLQLLKEARAFTMASHLHWVIWSIIQAQNSTIEFGYLEYAQQRLDQYYYLKRKWIASKSTSPQ